MKRCEAVTQWACRDRLGAGLELSQIDSLCVSHSDKSQAGKECGSHPGVSVSWAERLKIAVCVHVLPQTKELSLDLDASVRSEWFATNTTFSLAWNKNDCSAVFCVFNQLSPSGENPLTVIYHSNISLVHVCARKYSCAVMGKRKHKLLQLLGFMYQATNQEVSKWGKYKKIFKVEF